MPVISFCKKVIATPVTQPQEMGVQKGQNRRYKMSTFLSYVTVAFDRKLGLSNRLTVWTFQECSIDRYAICKTLELDPSDLGNYLQNATQLEILDGLISAEGVISLSNNWRLQSEFMDVLSCLPRCFRSEDIYLKVVPLVFYQLHKAVSTSESSAKDYINIKTTWSGLMNTTSYETKQLPIGKSF